MKRSRNLFPRACRLLARLLLLSGLIIFFGTLGILLAEALSPTPALPLPTPPSFLPPESSTTPNVHTSYLIWLIAILALFIIGLIISVRYINDIIRRAIVKTSHFFTLPIFATEITLTLLVWGSCTVLLLIVFPLFAILAANALAFNLLFFLLAWLTYHRPQYKL